MKPYLIALLGLIPICVSAQVTPNLQLQLPVEGSTGWGTKLNANFTSLDSYLSGTLSVPQITVTGAITNSNQLATKAYVDAHSGAFTLTTTGSSGAATLSNGVLNVPQYAGAAQVYPGAGVAVSTGTAWGTSLTLATVATSGSYTDLSNKPNIPAAQVNSDWNSGSGLSQILNKPSLATVATSGSYTDLSNRPLLSSGQLLYNQSGDTIASIETACSSLCTYIVTTPQTLTLAANHTLSSNVQLDFRSGGLWTVNGAFTLTIPGNVSGTLNQHFAGTSTIKFGLLQQYANGEWCGAVGDGTTNDYTALQACLNMLTAGQMVLQARTYSIGANTLSITKSSVGITGTTQAEIYASLFATPPASVILETGASQDVIDVAGASGSGAIFGNRLTNFTIERSQAPTGTTAAGLSLSYTYGAVVDHVVSMDSLNDFYIHASGSAGQGYIDNSVAMWGYNGVTISSGTLRGFFIDSQDGHASPSLRMHNDNVANGTTGLNVSGYVLYGEAFNDFMGWNLESAQTSYGAYIGATTTAIANGAQDIHFINPIFDQCTLGCLQIVNVPNSMSSSIDFDGGWMYATGGTQNAFISGANNVVIRGVQMGGAATNEAIVSTSSKVAFIGNNIKGNVGLQFSGGSDYTVDGNLINTSGNGVQLASSASHASISNNVFSGMTTAVSVAAGSTNISGLETNSYDSAVTTPVSSAVPFLIPPTGSETVTFSATPTFSNITQSSIITMTAAITSFTLAAGVAGQQKTLIFCQDATGGHGVTAPANVRGLTVGTTLSTCTTASLIYSTAQTAWMTSGTVQNQ